MGERIVNGIIFLLSSVYLGYAMQMPFGRLGAPRFGFIPQIVGWAAVALSAFLLVQSLLGKGDSRAVRLQTDWKSLALIVVTIILYILVLPYAGYIISSFLVLLAVLKIGKIDGWVKPLVISVSTSLVFYTIFKMALSVPLPPGILG